MKKSESIDIASLVKGKQIPILVLDEKWHMLFKDKDKTPRIQALEKNLMDALKKQGQITQDLKDLKKIKANLMEGIMANMDSEDDSKKSKINAKNQKMIAEINEKIEVLTDEEFDIPHVIRDANIELMIECVRVSFDRIEQNKADLVILDKWINEMRIELKKKLLMKQDKEIKNTETYAYLHDVLGQEIMQIFDDNESGNV